MFSLYLWLFSIIVRLYFFFFFSSRRRHTRLQGDWSSDVCSSDLLGLMIVMLTLSASTGPTLGAQGSATLTGLVTYRGPLPLPQKVTVNRDAAFCGATVTIQPLVVQATSQGVRNAVVSLSDPPEQPLDATPPPTIIKNRNCSFVSRISATRVGALVEIGNDDPVLHNTHIRGEGKTLLNVAMVPHGQSIQKQVKRPGLLDVKCDEIGRAH